MDAPHGAMTIGQLADRFGVATSVLRHWETMGLLTPAERVSGRRRYRAEHIARVALIMRSKEAGLTLGDIREMLQAPNDAARKAVLERHHATLEQRIAEAEAAKALVEHALSCPNDDFTTCLVFQRIVDLTTPWVASGAGEEGGVARDVPLPDHHHGAAGEHR